MTDIIKNWIFGPSDFEEPDPVKKVKPKKIKKESSFSRNKRINKEKNKKLEQTRKEEE